MGQRALFDEKHYRSPFAAGLGPFRIKGTAFRGIVEWADASIPGGMAAACSPLDADTRRFLEQPFLAASYYDYLPVFSMYIVAADLTKRPLVDVVRSVARHVAVRDVNGIYRFLVKLASPEFLIGRFSNAWKQYFNFGACTATVSGANTCDVRVTGFPTIAADPFTGVLEGWFAAAMEATRVKAHSFRRYPLEPAGVRYGIPLSDIELRFRWSHDRTTTSGTHYAER